MVSGKYLYKVCLDTTADIAEFVKIASRIDGNVWLVSESTRVNGKSMLGVLYAKVAWDKIFVECDTDCWWELRKFIEE